MTDDEDEYPDEYEVTVEAYRHFTVTAESADEAAHKAVEQAAPGIMWEIHETQADQVE